jgi:hypothetical protein
MPTIFEAKAGENSVHYIQHSLIRFYIDQSHSNALIALKNHQSNIMQAESIVAIMFAAMTLEAFVNEIAEDVVEEPNLNDFFRLRKEYRIENGESSLTAKIRILFHLKHNLLPDETLKEQIGMLVTIRNNLIHYRLSDLAGKRILPPMKKEAMPDGTYMTSIDFMAAAENVVPPFIQKITGMAAAESFNTALSLLKTWGELAGEPDNVPGLSQIVV